MKTSIIFAGRTILLEFDDRYYSSIDSIESQLGTEKLSWIAEANSAKWADSGEDVKKDGEYGRHLVMRLVADKVSAAQKLIEEAHDIAAEGGVSFVIEGGTYGNNDHNRYQRDVLLTGDGQWVLVEDAWSASGLNC